MIEVSDLYKSYHGRVIVNHVSLAIDRGEIVGLLGPNGAGKTTTFYMVVGIIKPDRGQVFLDGEEIGKMPMHQRARRGIGYLAQEASVFRKMSVEDNLRAVLEMSSLNQQEQRERMEDLLKEFHIDKIRERKGYQLSGGERRRVEIARALATDPKFILLDEPFSGIDPIAISDIQNMIFDLKKKNIGILITDHNVRETLSITDRAYVMNNGEILISGTSAEILNNPLAREHYLGEKFRI